MIYAGIDFHKRYSVIAERDETGALVREMRLSNDRTSLLGYIASLGADTKLAIEATCNWYYFYELIEEHDLDVTLVHPLKTKAIASAKIKTDTIDARTLSRLLRGDLIAPAYIPCRHVRDTREILRTRAFLVALRTRLKNRVHAILSKNGLECPYSDVFGKRSHDWLKGLDLRPCYRIPLASILRLADMFQGEIAQVDQEIDSRAIVDKDVRLLDTHPGIDTYSGLLIAMEIGAIERFPSPGKLCSYAGLVPSVYSSGDKTRRGALTKQGSQWLRWILIEMAHHATRGSERYRRLYTRVMQKHGKMVARVAVARKMLQIIFYMLKNKEPFKEHPALERSPVSASGS